MRWHLCFNWNCCASAFYSLDQFGGAVCVNIRIPWLWHPGSVETCRRGNCVLNVFTFQCMKGWLYRLNCASCTVHTILRWFLSVGWVPRLRMQGTTTHFIYALMEWLYFTVCSSTEFIVIIFLSKISMVCDCWFYSV